MKETTKKTQASSCQVNRGVMSTLDYHAQYLGHKVKIFGRKTLDSGPFGEIYRVDKFGVCSCGYKEEFGSSYSYA